MTMSDEVFMLFLDSSVVSEIENLPERLVLIESFPNGFDFFNRMAVKQLESLAELAEDNSTLADRLRNCDKYTSAIVRKKYLISGDISYTNLQVVLRRAFEFLVSEKFPLHYQREVLYRILVLGLFTGQKSASEFKDYLWLTQKTSTTYYDKFLMDIDDICPNMTQDEVKKEYEESFLGNTKGFENYYSTNDLKLRAAEANMLAGNHANQLDLPSDFVPKIAMRKELEFDRTNPQHFSVTEEVTLTLRRKNIPKMTIRVIEIAAERYYRSNFRAVPADLNLDGIDGESEIVTENGDKPLLRATETVTLPGLTGRSGLFAIEVMGGGLHARALVHKGALRHTTFPDEAGYQVYIYSQDGDLSRTDHTGVLLDGRFYAMEKDRDFTLIPYPERPMMYQSMVLISGNATEFLGMATFEPAKYELRARYEMAEDCTAAKRHCSVLVSPRLFLNGINLPLTRISKISAEVDIKVNWRSDLKATKSEFRSGFSSFYISFTFPEDYSKLTISLSAQLKDEKIPPLKESFNWFLSKYSDYHRLMDLYLVRKTNGYELHVLGRNGEGIPGATVTVATTSLYSTEESKETLSSNEIGVIALGALREVFHIKATLENSVRIDLRLKDCEERIAYPGTLTVLEGSFLEIPVVRYRSNLYVSLIRIDKFAAIERTRITIDQERHCVTITDLKQGEYRLVLPYNQGQAIITIIVVTGVQAKNGYIFTPGNSVPLSRSSLPLGFSSVVVSSGVAHIRLNGHCAHAELILKLNTFPKSPSLSDIEPEPLRPLPSSNSSNVYVASRLLDEEYRYILDRKSVPRRPGISYPLPSLLVHPHLESEAFTLSQLAEEGTEFLQPEVTNKEDQDSSDWMTDETDDPERESEKHFAFIANPAVVIANVAVDANCEAHVPLPTFATYPLLTVLAMAGGASAAISLPLSDDSILKQNIALSTSFSSDKAYAEVQTMKALRAGQSLNIGEVANSTSIRVDSLEALIDVILRYLPQFEKWTFLKEWDQLAIAEKEWKYSNFSGHELNFFLYNKDKPFFESHVKPAVATKFEKTFIDDLLLDKPLQKYAAFPQIVELDEIELALLARKTRNEEIISLLKRKQSAKKRSDRTTHSLFSDMFQDVQEVSIKPRSFRCAYVSLAFDNFLSRMTITANEYSETQYSTPAEREYSYEFWAEVAAANPQQLILTESVLFVDSSIREAVMALALIDLPWRAATLFAGESTVASVPSNTIILQKDIQSVPESLSNSYSVKQSIKDETGHEPKQFVKSRKYTATVTVSNAGQEEVTVDVLMQIPAGSIQLTNREATVIKVMKLNQRWREVQTSDYSFYFPEAGNFTHAGAYVAVEGVVVQRSAHTVISVADEETIFDENSFTGLARKGDLALIVKYLSTEDFSEEQVNFNEISWLMKNFTAFKSVTEVLRRRLVFVRSIWLFSTVHGSEQELRELLHSDHDIYSSLGCSFQSQLVSTGSEALQHLEYFPMVNSRVHPLGEHSRIANVQFHSTYVKFLRCLAEKQGLDGKDRLALAHYFVLQNRYAEAQQQIDSIADSPEAKDSQLQYDYLRAYLNDSLVPEVLEKYENTTIGFWKPKFEEMRKQFEDEIVADSSGQSQLLSIKLADATLRIYSEQIPKCELQAHKIDLELVFSRNPFLSSKHQLAIYTPASYSEAIPLLSGFLVNYTIPAALQHYPMILNLDCGSQSWSTLYFNSPLLVQVYSSVGLIRVTTETLEVVSGAYVKVYTRSRSGDVEFRKDGYTDGRGKFDYQTVMIKSGKPVEFSVFVEKEGIGATVVEISDTGAINLQ